MFFIHLKGYLNIAPTFCLIGFHCHKDSNLIENGLWLGKKALKIKDI